jgi:hypothetical protein
MMMLRLLMVVPLLAAGPAWAASGVRLTWSQTDCALVDRWEVLRAAILVSRPNPSPDEASLYATILNRAPVLCGPASQATVLVPVVGNARWWLRALTSDGFASIESPAVDRVIPLTPPGALGVEPVP